MTTVPIEKMRDKLATLTDVRTRLASTEPLSTEFLSSDSKIKFQIQPDWSLDFDSTGETDAIAAEITVNGKATALSKEALLLAASNIGLPKAYVRRTPAHLIESNLNYWYGGGMGEKAFNMLTVKDVASAFIAPTKHPYSNLSILDNALDGIQNIYGDTEIFADYKFNHSLQRTDVRLIVPSHSRVMEGTDMNDVPQGASDAWSAGIHLSNSLIGKTQTSVDSYLFRWWCTNGAIATMDEVGRWNRRHEASSEVDVYEWARMAVEDALGGMEDRFNDIQTLAHTNIAGNTADVLREVFSEFNVPVTQRALIQEQMLDANTSTMYSLMNAITSTANEDGLDPERADRMMRIGGYVPSATFENVKARIFAEGQVAGPQAPNRYAFGVAQ
jgi:hypothetical protein